MPTLGLKVESAVLTWTPQTDDLSIPEAVTRRAYIAPVRAAIRSTQDGRRWLVWQDADSDKRHAIPLEIISS